MRAVGAVCVCSGVVALIKPKAMLKLWPAREDAAQRLMQAWGIASFGLGLTLWGVHPAGATTVVAALSIPWDLSWSKWGFGHVAAAINSGCIVVLWPLSRKWLFQN